MSAAGAPETASDAGAARELFLHESLRRKQMGGLDSLLTRLLSSAGARFATVYATLFGLSSLALAVFVWWSTAGLLARQTDTSIDVDSRGLAERYAEGGLPRLLQILDQRISGNVDDDAIYMLVDPKFQRIGGNLTAWPRLLTMDDEWGAIPIERGGLRALARVHHFELPGGFHLLIGRDIDSRSQMRRLLGDALLWSVMIAGVLGVLGAFALRRLFAITLADISATAAAVSAGDLTRRVRKSGHGQEFDNLADTINDMLNRIGRLMDGVRQVSNAIAHDLRTPIARARARLEDAATHARGEADLRAALERAQADLDGVTAVFEALLRIAEIEAGSRRSAFADIDLAPLLADIADLYEAVAEERGLVLKAEIAGDLHVFGDRDMLQQAIANLLDNALKFSPEGGTVMVTAALQSPHLRVTVADQGPGIPEADRVRATERFYRGEQARNTPGSGLGLALVQAVASLHGGTLSLEDNEPGLRAVILLPQRVVVRTEAGDDASGDRQGATA